MDFDFGQISQQVSEYLKNPDSDTAGTPTPRATRPSKPRPSTGRRPCSAGQAPPPEPWSRWTSGTGRLEAHREADQGRLACVNRTTPRRRRSWQSTASSWSQSLPPTRKPWKSGADQGTPV